MLVDDVTILVRAGKGGDGSAHLLHTGQTYKGGPDGGNGGNGGSIYFQGTDDILALRQFRFTKKVIGQDGGNGLKQNLYGANGEDTIVKVPVGTIIKDVTTNRLYDIADTATLHLVAQGGIGGRGNNEFKSATNQTPKYAEKGTPGEEKTLRIKLRLIADVGLIGLPNAGKSSLLKALTNATPKIANYPFTTLEPNLGMMGHITIADIPGLIEGASKGKGLGIKFLQHVEKTKLLIHCISVENEDVTMTYHIVKKELDEYKETLSQKQEIILLTKIDLVSQSVWQKKQKELEKISLEVNPITILDENLIYQFSRVLANKVSAKT